MANITPIDRWNTLVQQQQYEAIISNPDQFWITFCMSRIAFHPETSFVKKEGDHFCYSVDCEPLREVIETVRKLFEASIKARRSSCLDVRKIQTGVTFLEDYFDLIHYKILVSGSEIEPNLYYSEISPAWPKLAESLGADFEQNTTQLLCADEESYEKIQELSFRWKWIKASTSNL